MGRLQFGFLQLTSSGANLALTRAMNIDLDLNQPIGRAASAIGSLPLRVSHVGLHGIGSRLLEMALLVDGRLVRKSSLLVLSRIERSGRRAAATSNPPTSISPDPRAALAPTPRPRLNRVELCKGRPLQRSQRWGLVAAIG